VGAVSRCASGSRLSAGARARTASSRAPAVGSRASSTLPRLRCPRTSSHRRLTHRHCGGSAGTPRSERPSGSSCPRACRSDNSIRTLLSRVRTSAASQPSQLELVDSSSIPRAVASSVLGSGAGPLPSARVTGLHGYYEPIRHLSGPTRALAGWSFSGAQPPSRDPRPGQTSLVSYVPFLRVLPPLPRWVRGLRTSLAWSSVSVFPVILAGRHPQRPFGACSMFTSRCGPRSR
jgi:hypothetical protein